jgi:glutaredoxin|tara:strand:+ start:147 stop:422 length:276 start_codon:yes stop_codon:yes gene_type:complete
MNITLYTTKGCSSCAHAKKLCNRANVEFTEIEPGAPNQIAKWEFQTQFPDVRGFPFVVIKQEGEEDIQMIGVVELAKLFLKKGLVSSRKNG